MEFQSSVVQFSGRCSHRFEFFLKHSHPNHIFCWQHFLRLFVISYVYFVLKGAVNEETKKTDKFTISE